MNRAEWDAIEAWEKNALVGESVMGWEDAGFCGEMLTGFRTDGLPEEIPSYTTDRNACALVLDEIERRGLLHDQFAQILADMLVSDMIADELIAGLRADPDTICYAALKAVEDEA